MTKEERSLLLALCAVLISEAVERGDRQMLDRLQFLKSYIKPFTADVAELAEKSAEELVGHLLDGSHR